MNELEKRIEALERKASPARAEIDKCMMMCADALEALHSSSVSNPDGSVTETDTTAQVEELRALQRRLRRL